MAAGVAASGICRNHASQLRLVSFRRCVSASSRRSQIVLFPVRIDETVMKTSEPWAVKLRDQRHIGDFRGWKDHDAYKQAFDRVLRDLKAMLK